MSIPTLTLTISWIILLSPSKILVNQHNRPRIHIPPFYYIIHPRKQHHHAIDNHAPIKRRRASRREKRPKAEKERHDQKEDPGDV